MFEEEISPAAPFLFGVYPVSCDAVFRFIVHFLSTDLNFEYAAFRTEDGGVERLVAVRFWKGDVVLDAAHHRSV